MNVKKKNIQNLRIKEKKLRYKLLTMRFQKITNKNFHNNTIRIYNKQLARILTQINIL